MASRPSQDLWNVRKATQAAPRICTSVSTVARGLTTNVLAVDFFGYLEKEDTSNHVYNLEALIVENGLHLVHNKEKEKVDKDGSAEKLVTSVIQDMQTGYECTCYANRELCGIQALRYDNLVSLKQKPDVMVVVDTGTPLDGSSTLKLPILLVEVHSKDSSPPAQSYEHTKNKLIIGMVNQFRYLTNYCNEASNLQLTGFVFPADEPFGVTEVKLFLSCKPGENFEFEFVAVEKRLPNDHIKVNIEQAISTMLKLQFTNVVGHLCYIRLSTDHIRAIGSSTCTNSEALQQVRTPSSVLLTNGTEYIKVYPRQRSRMVRDLISAAPLKQFLLPTRSYFKQIFCFPALPHSPLTREEAKQCLTQLVGGVAKALKEIHANPHFIAHVDVRLENICFEENGTPILIDPDRLVDSRDSACSPTYEGLLYNPKTSKWKMFNIDWMQLGYMVAYIVQNNYQNYPQAMEIDEEINRDPFIMALINEGMYSEDLKRVSDVLNEADHQMDILAVLEQRN